MANYIINECLTNDEYIISAVTLTLDESIRFGVGEDLFCGTVIGETINPITPLFYLDGEYSNCCECLADNLDSLNFHFIRCGIDEDISIEATEFCSQIGLPITGLTYEIQYGLLGTPFCATFQGLSSTGATNYSYSSGPFSNCEDCEQSPIGAYLVVSCDYPLLGGPVNATQFTESPIDQVYQLCTDRGEFSGFTDENCLCFQVFGTRTEPYPYDFGISGPFSNCEDCGEEPPRSANTEYTMCIEICDGTYESQDTPHPVYTDGYGTPVTQLNMVALGGPNGLNS